MAFTVSEIASWIGARVANASAVTGGVDQIRVERPASLAEATSGSIAFFFASEYQAELMGARPSVLVTADPFLGPLEKSGLPLWKNAAILSCVDPYLAMAIVSEHFAPLLSGVSGLEAPRAESEIHPSAQVHATAQIEQGVHIGAGTVVEEGAKVGAGTRIYPGCFIGPRVQIGRNCTIFAQVSLYEKTRMGDRVRLHSGVVIGADGFGYAPVKDSAGKVCGHRKIHHLGGVVLGNDVEVGANTCIDRGTFGDTKIGNQVKIDNLVQVGHNCEVGDGAVLCGNVGLAGSARVGRFAYIGGGAGLGNRVSVGDGAMIGGYSGISKDVKAGGQAMGYPQREPRIHFRANAILNRMAAEGRKK